MLQTPSYTPARTAAQTGASPGRGHWFDPSTAHHSRLGHAWRVRQSDRESFTDGRRSLLYGLEQDVGVLWVEQSLKLAAAGPHPLRHLALGNTLLPHRFADFPGQHTLPSKSCHFLVKPLRPQKLIERRTHMSISPLCHLQPPSAASQRAPDRSRASAVSS